MGGGLYKVGLIGGPQKTWGILLEGRASLQHHPLPLTSPAFSSLDPSLITALGRFPRLQDYSASLTCVITVLISWLAVIGANSPAPLTQDRLIKHELQLHKPPRCSISFYVSGFFHWDPKLALNFCGLTHLLMLRSWLKTAFLPPPLKLLFILQRQP